MEIWQVCSLLVPQGCRNYYQNSANGLVIQLTSTSKLTPMIKHEALHPAVAVTTKLGLCHATKPHKFSSPIKKLLFFYFVVVAGKQPLSFPVYWTHLSQLEPLVTDYQTGICQNVGSHHSLKSFKCLQMCQQVPKTKKV